MAGETASSGTLDEQGRRARSSQPPTTLERLRVLHAVVANGTIAGAARTLSYTPSAVSQHLSALEREVATPLVERSNRGVVPTPAGRLLAARASNILDLVRNAFDEVGAVGGRAEAEITVAAFPTAISTLLLPVVAPLAPAIRLTIVDAESEAALAALRARNADCAITDGLADERRGRSDDLHRTVVRIDSLHLVTRVDRVERSITAYRDAPWVIFRSGSRLGTAVRHFCASAGFDPRLIAETDDHHTTFDVVRATGAVAVLPALALAELPVGIAIAEHIAVPIERRIELVTRRPLHENPAIAELARALADLQG